MEKGSKIVDENRNAYAYRIALVSATRPPSRPGLSSALSPQPTLQEATPPPLPSKTTIIGAISPSPTAFASDAPVIFTAPKLTEKAVSETPASVHALAPVPVSVPTTTTPQTTENLYTPAPMSYTPSSAPISYTPASAPISYTPASAAPISYTPASAPISYTPASAPISYTPGSAAPISYTLASAPPISYTPAIASISVPVAAPISTRSVNSSQTTPPVTMPASDYTSKTPPKPEQPLTREPPASTPVPKVHDKDKDKDNHKVGKIEAEAAKVGVVGPTFPTGNGNDTIAKPPDTSPEPGGSGSCGEWCKKNCCWCCCD